MVVNMFLQANTRSIGESIPVENLSQASSRFAELPHLLSSALVARFLYLLPYQAQLQREHVCVFGRGGRGAIGDQLRFLEGVLLSWSGGLGEIADRNSA